MDPALRLVGCSFLRGSRRHYRPHITSSGSAPSRASGCSRRPTETTGQSSLEFTRRSFSFEYEVNSSYGSDHRARDRLRVCAGRSGKPLGHRPIITDSTRTLQGEGNGAHHRGLSPYTNFSEPRRVPTSAREQLDLYGSRDHAAFGHSTVRRHRWKRQARPGQPGRTFVRS